MKLGRKPRAFNPAVPHFSALRFSLAAAPTFPEACDYTIGLPADLGAMGNLDRGDCTCAAMYHAEQVWTHDAGTLDTEPADIVLKCYSEFCGYVPGDPSTDQGGVEQDVLADWMRKGIPLSDGSVNKLAAFVELDPGRQDDIKAAIYSAGGVYIGFDVPRYLMAGQPPDVWALKPDADNAIIGGHAVFVAGYDATAVTLISWGRLYKMEWPFWVKFVDEALCVGRSIMDREDRQNAARPDVGTA